MKKQKDKKDIQNLLDIMAQLRDRERGCPWDLEQTFATIAPYTIEEAYEVADVIERDALAELADELGDLLLQVVYHARMAEEAGLFDFGDVVARISEKMVRRHPHVFGDESVANAAAQTQAWEEIKAAEREASSAREPASLLADVPKALPALMRAVKLGRRASRVGFDWPDLEGVRAKVDEELRELDAALAGNDSVAAADELGDALFALANLSRHIGVDAEAGLRAANQRFARRFGRVEAGVHESGRDWAEFTIDELERLWQEAKTAERETGR